MADLVKTMTVSTQHNVWLTYLWLNTNVKVKNSGALPGNDTAKMDIKTLL